MESLNLRSARVLLVEDDFIILMDLESMLGDAGAQIVGSCRTVEAALAMADRSDIDAALLDVRLGQETIAPVARILARRGIPFAFYSAQSRSESTLAEWPKSVILGKPASPTAIIGTIAGLLRRG
jgi:DNA-binding response OmpR family regulator